MDLRPLYIFPSLYMDAVPIEWMSTPNAPYYSVLRRMPLSNERHWTNGIRDCAVMSSGKYILLVVITSGAWSKVNFPTLSRFDRYEETQPVLNTLLTATMDRNRCAVWCFIVDTCVAISLHNVNTSTECVIYPVNGGQKSMRLYPSTEWTTYVKGKTLRKYLHMSDVISYICRKSVISLVWLLNHVRNGTHIVLNSSFLSKTAYYEYPTFHDLRND